MDVQTPHSLPDDVDKLKGIINKQREMLHSKSLLIDRMQVMLDRYQQQRFGSSSEKFPGQHASLIHANASVADAALSLSVSGKKSMNSWASSHSSILCCLTSKESMPAHVRPA